jgi:hypothetical protein
MNWSTKVRTSLHNAHGNELHAHFSRNFWLINFTLCPDDTCCHSSFEIIFCYCLPSAKSGVVIRINMVTYIHFEFRGFENEFMPEGELSWLKIVNGFLWSCQTTLDLIPVGRHNAFSLPSSVGCHIAFLQVNTLLNNIHSDRESVHKVWGFLVKQHEFLFLSYYRIAQIKILSLCSKANSFSFSWSSQAYKCTTKLYALRQSQHQPLSPSHLTVSYFDFISSIRRGQRSKLFVASSFVIHHRHLHVPLHKHTVKAVNDF